MLTQGVQMSIACIQAMLHCSKILRKFTILGAARVCNGLPQHFRSDIAGGLDLAYQYL